MERLNILRIALAAALGILSCQPCWSHNDPLLACTTALVNHGAFKGNEDLARAAVHYLSMAEQALAHAEASSEIRQKNYGNPRFHELAAIVGRFRELKNLASLQAENEALAKSDPDLKELIEEENKELERKMVKLADQLKAHLANRSLKESKKTIMELRPTAGASRAEAVLFAKQLSKAYEKFSQKKKWKLDILSSSEDEIVFSVEGEDAYRLLRNEQGIHRLRTPSLNNSSRDERVHVQTVSIVVLPVAMEKELHINDSDFEIERGPGGHDGGKTETGIHMTHKPTGLSVYMQSGHKQHVNIARAKDLLLARLKARKAEEEAAKLSSTRRAQIGIGKAGGQARSYDLVEQKVTDKRAAVKIHAVRSIEDLDMGPLLEKVADHVLLEDIESWIKEPDFGV